MLTPPQGNNTGDGDFEELTTRSLTNGVAGSGNTVSKLGSESIATKTPSATSEVEFTTGIDGSYSQYRLQFSHFSPTGNSGGYTFQMEISTDGGANWETGASDYKWANKEWTEDGTTANNGSGDGDSNFQINDKVGDNDVPKRSISGEILLFDPSNGDVPPQFRCDYVLHVQATDLNPRTGAVAGSYQSETSYDGVRLKFGSTNIEAGTVSLEGRF